MGMGSASTISLAKVRQRAAEAREQISDGLDPIALKRQRHGISFEEAARELIAGLAPAWRSKRTKEQWETALRVHCAPICPMRVADISTEDVLRVLRPIWANKNESASRLRGQIENVLDFAKVRGFRSGENPARWRGHLSAVLPRGSKLARPHHTAMPFDEVPAFLARLQAGGVAARAVEFLVFDGWALGRSARRAMVRDRPGEAPLDNPARTHEGEARASGTLVGARLRSATRTWGRSRQRICLSGAATEPTTLP